MGSIGFRNRVLVLAGAFGFALSGFAGAQTATAGAKRGMADYQAHCLKCHGAKGKGDGRIMDMQNRRLPDLGRLASRNKGVFPAERVMEIIDGTGVIVIHGTAGMPVWGKAMRDEATQQCKAPGCDPEAMVRERLRALVDYLALLQEK